MALLVSSALVADTLAAPLVPTGIDGGIRQKSSYEQVFNPFGDPWSAKMGSNRWIPVGLTPACAHHPPKSTSTTPNPDEVAFLAKTNNQIQFDGCADPMEASGGPQRNGDPALRSFIAAVKQANPLSRYIGYVKAATHSTGSLGAPITPAGLLDFERVESYFIHVNDGPVTKSNRVKAADGRSDIYDITNAQWRQDFANHLKASMDFHGLDGLVVDDCFDRPLVTGAGPSAAKLAAWQQGCVATLATIKRTAPDKIIVPTGYLHYGSSQDEATAFQFMTQRVDVSDGFYWEDPLRGLLTAQPPAEADRIHVASVKRFRDVQDYVMSRPGNKYFGHQVNTSEQSSFTTTNPTEQVRLQRFFLAGHLALHANDRSVLHLWTPFQFDRAFNTAAFFKDWDFNIGAPTGNPTQPAGAVVPIYQREFQRARVVLNATDRAFTVNLSDGTFRTLDGQAVTSFAMPPKSGMVFLLPGSDPFPIVPPETLACTPRPPVRTTVQSLGGGRLQADIVLDQGGGYLRSVQVEQPRNATVDIVNGPTGLTGPHTFQAVAGATSARLLIQRLSPGPFTVQLRVTDGCGEWRTLAGGGADVP